MAQGLLQCPEETRTVPQRTLPAVPWLLQPPSVGPAWGWSQHLPVARRKPSHKITLTKTQNPQPSSTWPPACLYPPLPRAAQPRSCSLGITPTPFCADLNGALSLNKASMGSLGLKQLGAASSSETPAEVSLGDIPWGARRELCLVTNPLPPKGTGFTPDTI